MKKNAQWLLFFSVLAFSALLLSAEEQFQARLLGNLGPGSQRASKFVIVVESYTSTEEVLELINIYHSAGYDQYKSAIEAMEIGSARPTGGRGVKFSLNLSQSTPTEKGRQVLLVAKSQSWDLDTRIGYDSRYPFMVIELDLNEKGKGNGKIYQQADIRLTAEGIIEMASSGSPPRQLVGVAIKK